MVRWFLGCADHKEQPDALSEPLGEGDEAVLYTEKAVDLWAAIAQFEKRAATVVPRPLIAPSVEWSAFNFGAFKLFMVRHGACEIYLLSSDGQDKPVSITYSRSWYGANPLKKTVEHAIREHQRSQHG